MFPQVNETLSIQEETKREKEKSTSQKKPTFTKWFRDGGEEGRGLLLEATLPMVTPNSRNSTGRRRQKSQSKTLTRRWREVCREELEREKERRNLHWVVQAPRVVNIPEN